MNGPGFDFAADERWMQVALGEAARAADQGEVPVGAVAVAGGRIIGRGANQVEKLQDPTAHAEILALGAAAGTLGNWRLNTVTLYVTLEPCTMCTGAILLGRLGRLVFGAADPRAGMVVSGGRLLDGNPYRHQVAVTGGVLASACEVLLRDFFAARRSDGP